MVELEKSSSLDERKRELIRVLLLKDLDDTDFAIISAVTRLRHAHQRHPTASMIKRELATIHPLKRTQLYDRLSYLRELGFVSVDPFMHPRAYRIDTSTVTSGSEEWLRRQRQELARVSKSLEDSIRAFEEATPIDVVRIVDDAVQSNDGHGI